MSDIKFEFLCNEPQPAGAMRHDPHCLVCRGTGRIHILTILSKIVHYANKRWWHDPKTGEPIQRNKGEQLMLIVSEISEAMEGERRNLQDDKLPHRPMAEVELADALVRIFDYAGGHGYDLGGAFAEKMAYNAVRHDHTNEGRLSEGGKKW